MSQTDTDTRLAQLEERVDGILDRLEELGDRLNAIERDLGRSQIDHDDVCGRIDALSRRRRREERSAMTLPGNCCSRDECEHTARACRECVRAIPLQVWGAIARHAADIAARGDLCELGLAEACGEHFLDDVAEHRARMRELGHRIGEPDPPDTLAVFAQGVEEGRAQAAREGRS